MHLRGLAKLPRATRLPHRLLDLPLAAALCGALLWPAAAPAAAGSGTAQVGTLGPDDAKGVAVDAGGNVYVTGHTSG